MGYPTTYSGVYLLRKRGSEKGVDHYGVGVAGNWVMRLQKSYPVVVNLMPSSLEVDYWDETKWIVLEESRDPRLALDRMTAALEDQAWSLLWNNCEQFAREIVTGKRESKQLQGAAMTGLAVLAVLALGSKR